MLLRGVLEQLGQLQGVLADLLHWGEQEAVDGDVDHLLEQAASFKEVSVPALLHQVGQLGAGARMVVTVLGIDGKALLLGREAQRRQVIGRHRAMMSSGGGAGGMYRLGVGVAGREERLSLRGGGSRTRRPGPTRRPLPCTPKVSRGFPGRAAPAATTVSALALL